MPQRPPANAPELPTATITAEGIDKGLGAARMTGEITMTIDGDTQGKGGQERLETGGNAHRRHTLTGPGRPGPMAAEAGSWVGGPEPGAATG